HHSKIARELGVVAILRAPLVELRHRLRQRETGQLLAIRSLPGTQQALVQLTHVLQQDALVFRPLAGPTDGHGNLLWGHGGLLLRYGLLLGAAEQFISRQLSPTRFGAHHSIVRAAPRLYPP